MPTLEATALAFDRACRDATVLYAFIGGIAVGAWGIPRATADVDVLLDLPEGKVAGFVRSMHAEGLKVAFQDILDSLSDQSHVTAFDERSLYHVDIKLVSKEPDRDQVRQAVEVPLHGARLRVARPEDTVAFKLLYGTPQDVADARSIVVRQGKRLDRRRLRALARDLGVGPALDDLLAEASTGEP